MVRASSLGIYDCIRPTIVDREEIKAGIGFAILLFVAVLASRALTETSVYYADGPLHIAAVENHTYVIQAPGYWLFNRTAGLFPHAEVGIAIMNWLFSALGAVAFYFALRMLVQETVARVAAIAYASVCFAWFSGNVHSSYASQLFFPVAVLLCLLHYQESRKLGWLIGGSVLFALGAGFRPSDGIFLAPAFLFGIRNAKRKHLLVCLPLVGAVCLAWLVPQSIALAQMDDPIRKSTRNHLLNIADGVLVSGFSPFALSNALRYFLPLGLVLLPLLPLILTNRKEIFLWLWIVPGSLFFLLVYMSDAPYLDVLLAPFLILAACNVLFSERQKVLLFLSCAVFNIFFFFACRPVGTGNSRLQLAEYVFEADLGKYTYWDVQHHYAPLLRDLLHVPGFKLPHS